MQLVRDPGSFSPDLRILCWIHHIQEEGKWEGSGEILEVRPGNVEMVHFTSIHI